MCFLTREEGGLFELPDSKIKLNLDRRERALGVKSVVRRLGRVGSADFENASAPTNRRFRLELVYFQSTQEGKASMN